jgi:hypothetical protein
MMRPLTVAAIALLAATAIGQAMGETGMRKAEDAGTEPATSAPTLAQNEAAAEAAPDSVQDKAAQDKAAQDKLAASAPTPAPPPVDPKVLKANNWTLGLASGLPEGAFIRFGAEIARNLNDGDKLRVMPLITHGATENVTDLLYLRGVDVALTNADVLEHFRSVEKMPNIERKIQYVAGMYITHLHVPVRADIAP